MRIDRFFENGEVARLPGDAAAIAAANYDVVVTTGDREIVAMRKAGVTAPIIFTFVSDPVGRGFVKSLARPGGNITGFSSHMLGLSQKLVELLREVVPGARQFTVVATASNTRPAVAREFDSAARAFGMTITMANVTGPDTYAGVLARSRSAGATGIIVPMDGQTFRHRKLMADLMIGNRLAAIFGDAGYVQAGGLLSYSSSFPDRLRRAAGHVDRILSGTRVSDLPAEEPAAFDLVVNLRTAKDLGLTIPKSILLRANHVIE